MINESNMEVLFFSISECLKKKIHF